MRAVCLKFEANIIPLCCISDKVIEDVASADNSQCSASSACGENEGDPCAQGNGECGVGEGGICETAEETDCW